MINKEYTLELLKDYFMSCYKAGYENRKNDELIVNQIDYSNTVAKQCLKELIYEHDKT